MRKQDRALRRELDGVLGLRTLQIRALLREYGVPLVADAAATPTAAVQAKPAE